MPGAVVAIQTFGGFLGFHPHLHILVSDGCFHENGMFSVSPAVNTKALERMFRHKVLKMLLAKGKITQDMITLLNKWRHTGFEVDPLVCPKCSSAMRVIAFIEDSGVIKKILKHLSLWDIKRKPRPTANAPPILASPM